MRFALVIAAAIAHTSCDKVSAVVGPAESDPGGWRTTGPMFDTITSLPKT
jgi:hypothetical protein